MARSKPNFIKGTSRHRRTEGAYMAALLDTVELKDWREVVKNTVDAAKKGDAAARTWLAQYLIGKPGLTAPAPLTVVVQQLSGADPIAERLAAPHIQREKYPGLHEDDDFEENMRELAGLELRALEAQQSGSAPAARRKARILK